LAVIKTKVTGKTAVEIKRRSEIVKKVLFVILAVLMMVGLMSGLAFAESKFTGFDASPAFVGPTELEGFQVYVHINQVPIFCAGITAGFDTNIKVVPGNAHANANENSAVIDFNGMTLVDPSGVW
jgi:hypothetical protein